MACLWCRWMLVGVQGFQASKGGGLAGWFLLAAGAGTKTRNAHLKPRLSFLPRAATATPWLAIMSKKGGPDLQPMMEKRVVLQLRGQKSQVSGILRGYFLVCFFLVCIFLFFAPGTGCAFPLCSPSPWWWWCARVWGKADPATGVLGVDWLALGGVLFSFFFFFPFPFFFSLWVGALRDILFFF